MNVRFGNVLARPATLFSGTDKTSEKRGASPQTPDNTAGDTFELGSRRRIHPETMEALAVFDDSYGFGLTPRSILKTVIELYDVQASPHREAQAKKRDKYEKDHTSYENSRFKRFKQKPLPPILTSPDYLKVSDLEKALSEQTGVELTGEAKKALQDGLQDLSRWGFLGMGDAAGWTVLATYPTKVGYDLKDAQAE